MQKHETNTENLGGGLNSHIRQYGYAYSQYLEHTKIITKKNWKKKSSFQTNPWRVHNKNISNRYVSSETKKTLDQPSLPFFVEFLLSLG